jgi:hypothetical protein
MVFMYAGIICYEIKQKGDITLQMHMTSSLMANFVTDSLFSYFSSNPHFCFAVSTNFL